MVFLDQVTPVLDQHAQKIEDLRCERYNPPLVRQPLVVDVQPEGPELIRPAPSNHGISV